MAGLLTSLRALSLRWKVPALITVLLVFAVGTFGLIAYATVRRTAIESAISRETAAAANLAQLLGNSIRSYVRQLEAAGSHPAILAHLRAPDAPLSDSSRAVLQRLTRDSVQVIGVELLDRRGRPVLRRGVDRLATEALEWTPTDTVPVSPFFVVRGERIAIQASAPIRERGTIVGRVVVSRVLQPASGGLEALSDLIGDGATVLLGNADGSLWSDLETLVTRPVDSAAARRYRRAGEMRLSGAAAVPGTPWIVAVEAPEGVALGPARAVIRRFSAIAVLIVALGAVAGMQLSRGITRPLEQLTVSAEAIAGGDLERRDVALDRSDEIGRLGRAFATMADSVRQTRDHLETRIGERTAELETALTQLRDAQEELLRKERLATLGQISSSIGHELRNPLAVMLNAVYFLDATVDDKRPKVREYLGLIREQIRLSERIVSDLLDSVRSRPPQRAAICLPEFLEEQVRRVPLPASIRYACHVPADVPPVLADRDQVGQILFNLLTNAVQAMDGREGTLTVGVRQNGPHVCIEVCDTGDGVPEALREKIFEPLFTTKARGIGLGLSVSRTLARANGGDLKAVNPSGHGAVFVLELPAGDPTSS